MRKNKTITLTTDFGEGSFYAASMKGVILSINPDATIVDVTHSIAQGDILCRYGGEYWTGWGGLICAKRHPSQNQGEV